MWCLLTYGGGHGGSQNTHWDNFLYMTETRSEFLMCNNNDITINDITWHTLQQTSVNPIILGVSRNNKRQIIYCCNHVWCAHAPNVGCVHLATFQSLPGCHCIVTCRSNQTILSRSQQEAIRGRHLGSRSSQLVCWKGTWRGRDTAHVLFWSWALCEIRSCCEEFSEQ